MPDPSAVPSAGREQITVAPDFAPPDVQPQWRQDFPIDWPQDQYVGRREFTRFMVLTSAAFAAGQLWIGIQNWWRAHEARLPIRRIAAAEELAIGGAVTFAYPRPEDSSLLVRLGPSEFVAFSQKCTHLSCAVVPRPAEGIFYCPCHEGRFDVRTGAPLAGPPRRPLPRIQLEVRDGQVYAVGIEGAA